MPAWMLTAECPSTGNKWAVDFFLDVGPCWTRFSRCRIAKLPDFAAVKNYHGTSLQSFAQKAAEGLNVEKCWLKFEETSWKSLQLLCTVPLAPELGNAVDLGVAQLIRGSGALHHGQGASPRHHIQSEYSDQRWPEMTRAFPSSIIESRWVKTLLKSAAGASFFTVSWNTLDIPAPSRIKARWNMPELWGVLWPQLLDHCLPEHRNPTLTGCWFDLRVENEDVLFDNGLLIPDETPFCILLSKVRSLCKAYAAACSG